MNLQVPSWILLLPIPSLCVYVPSRSSRVQLFATLWTVAVPRLLCPWDFPVKNTGVGCCFFFQGIFPTQVSNPYLLHLLHLHAGSYLSAPPGKPPEDGGLWCLRRETLSSEEPEDCWATGSSVERDLFIFNSPRRTQDQSSLQNNLALPHLQRSFQGCTVNRVECGH